MPLCAAALAFHLSAQIGKLHLLLLPSELYDAVQVAVVRSCGTPQQCVWSSTIEEVEELTAGEELSPCIVVVGQVVQLPQTWGAAAAGGGDGGVNS